MVELAATILVWGAVAWVTAPVWLLAGLAVVVGFTSGGADGGE
jgi:hypothetical protein